MSIDHDLEIKKSENVLAGIVGAFLFSLAGGVIWFVLYQVGFLAGVSGLVGVVCAIKGYQVFSKGTGKLGIILSVIIAMLTIVLAWYCCISLDLYKAFQEWYAAGEMDYTLDYFGCLRSAYKLFDDMEIAGDYFVDLAIGLGLCILGSIKPISAAFKAAKADLNDLPPAASAPNVVDSQNPSVDNWQPQAYDNPSYQAPQNQPYDWEKK